MSKATIFMADGMEEVECLTIVDILRRGNVDVQTISISNKNEVLSAHNIKVIADTTLEKADCSDSDILIVPGGVTGVKNLSACEKVNELLKRQNSEGKRLAAICAGPSVLGQLGLLAGKKMTCYPGWEEKCINAQYTGVGVITDGTITTGRGLGFAIDFALELLRLLKGSAQADEVKKGIQHPSTI